MKLHPSKCWFAFPKVPNLGHIISAKGFSPNSDKVWAVRDYPVKTSVRAIREFLDIAGYYQQFIPNFTTVPKPLYHLIKKDVPYMWSSACQEAFTRLKKLLISPPVLAYPNFDRWFVLHTDASSQTREAVWHNWHGSPWHGVGRKTLQGLPALSWLPGVHRPCTIESDAKSKASDMEACQIGSRDLWTEPWYSVPPWKEEL